MVKFFWEIYYSVKKPITKTDVILWYCRTKGIKYEHLRNTKVAFKEFKSLPKIEKEA